MDNSATERRRTINSSDSRKWPSKAELKHFHVDMEVKEKPPPSIPHYQWKKTVTVPENDVNGGLRISTSGRNYHEPPVLPNSQEATVVYSANVGCNHNIRWKMFDRY